MGNVSGRENGGRVSGGVGGEGGGGLVEDIRARSNAEPGLGDNHAQQVRVPSTDLMVNSPPRSPRQSRSPLSFPPQAQVPIGSLQGDVPPSFSHMWRNEAQGNSNQPLKPGVPMLITWSYGGNNVALEGSWDNWTSRRTLQKSGKDHTILLVLPCGIYHYKFIVDGNVKYIPDLPYEADEMGNVVNLLDVCDYIPENFEGVAELEAPSSPESSYNQDLLQDEDYAKDPVVVPPQLQVTVLGAENSNEAASSSTKPRHVVLNHLFVEKGWASQSVVAFGLSHRFQTKYVTVVLYKPLKSQLQLVEHPSLQVSYEKQNKWKKPQASSQSRPYGQQIDKPAAKLFWPFQQHSSVLEPYHASCKFNHTNKRYVGYYLCRVYSQQQQLQVETLFSKTNEFNEVPGETVTD